MDKEQIQDILARSEIVTVPPHVNYRFGYPNDIVVYCDNRYALDEYIGARLAKLLDMTYVSIDTPIFDEGGEGGVRSQVWVYLRNKDG